MIERHEFREFGKDGRHQRIVGCRLRKNRRADLNCGRGVERVASRNSEVVLVGVKHVQDMRRRRGKGNDLAVRSKVGAGSSSVKLPLTRRKDLPTSLILGHMYRRLPDFLVHWLCSINQEALLA